MEGPPLGPGGEDITWPDQVAPRGRKASSTRKIKPQTSNLGAGTWRSAPLLPMRVQFPCPCVRGARGRFGGLGPVPGVVSLPFPPSRPACPALLVAGRPVWVSLTLARWYAIPRGLCVPRARSGCPSGSPRVPFACVCARAPAASAPHPPGWSGVRTSRGRGTGRW